MVRGYSGPMEEIGSKYEERSAMQFEQGEDEQPDYFEMLSPYLIPVIY